jgi:hypothetical protein
MATSEDPHRALPPNEISPSLRFARYVVEPTTLAYAGVDRWTAEQLRTIPPTWRVMTYDELLEAWRSRT